MAETNEDIQAPQRKTNPLVEFSVSRRVTITMLILLALHQDMSTMIVDDAVHHGKSHTCAGADILGGEEGFENPS